MKVQAGKSEKNRLKKRAEKTQKNPEKADLDVFSEKGIDAATGAFF
jgi:hypothetical protein